MPREGQDSCGLLPAISVFAYRAKRLHRYPFPKSVQGCEVENGQVKQKIIEAIQGKAQVEISLCYCVTITSSPNNFHIVQYCIILKDYVTGLSMAHRCVMVDQFSQGELGLKGRWGVCF